MTPEELMNREEKWVRTLGEYLLNRPDLEIEDFRYHEQQYTDDVFSVVITFSTRLGLLALCNWHLPRERRAEEFKEINFLLYMPKGREDFITIEEVIEFLKNYATGTTTDS